MRRFLIFLVLFLIVLAYLLNGFAFAAYTQGGRYSLHYQNGEMSDEYSLTLFEAVLSRFGKGGVSGESIRFQGGDEEINKIIKRLRIEIRQSQKFANISTFYGYSARLGEGVTLEGRKINIQIVKKGNTVIVGTPLVLGSY